MVEPSFDPLDSKLQRLFDEERSVIEADRQMQSAVLAHVELAVALAAVGTAATQAGGVGKIGAGSLASKSALTIAAAAFVAGAVTGGTAVRSWLPISSPSSPRLEAQDPGVSPTIPLSIDAGLAEPTAPPSAPRPSTTDDPQRPPNPKRARGALLQEREVLDVAKAALARGEPKVAIVSLEQHLRAWPQGLMREEREVLWIQALTMAGRRAEALQRAKQFRSAYPNSILLPAVDAATEAPPTQP
jgi:hypothetical protein